MLEKTNAPSDIRKGMSLDQSSLRRYEAQCTQESPPKCQEACPFSLDCRLFLRNMALGTAAGCAAARAVLTTHIPLPATMVLLCDHPCEDFCLRRDFGGSLALHELERACMAQALPTSRFLPMPAKRFRMAIVGAGLAGFVAAWDLARKAYPVTLFYEDCAADCAASLTARYPILATQEGRAAFAADRAVLEQRKVTFTACQATPDFLAQVQEEYAAVLLDVSVCASLDPGQDAVDPMTLRAKGSLCCAGWPQVTPTGHTYASSSREAGQGRYAAQTMERLAGGLSLTAVRNKSHKPLHTDRRGVPYVPRIEPAGLYTQEEAAQEAQRCLFCDCLQCVRNCAHLQKHGAYPRTYARQIHNNATIVKGIHAANAVINGCALCGQCEELCPEHFSMAELCLAAREDLVAKGAMPPSAHEFALEDMEQASGAEAFLLLRDPRLRTGEKHAWLFFPGCQLSASRGEQLVALFSWLAKHLWRTCDSKRRAGGLALVLSCCGQPAYWAGQRELFRAHTERLLRVWEEVGRPRVLTACASCLAAFREALPEIPAQSVWEILDSYTSSELASLLALGLSGTPASPDALLPHLFSIHDPCAARHDRIWQDAVRNLARKAGRQIDEPALGRETTGCCGYGGLVWCAQADTADAMARSRAAQLPNPALASCSMCRDRFVASGTACWHILDLLMPHVPAPRADTPAPGLAQRRCQRVRLREALLREGGKLYEEQTQPWLRLGDTYRLDVQDASCIRLEQTLQRQLEERHILCSDIEEAVLAAEASRSWCLNTLNGHRVGWHRPRKVTFWVEYAPCERTDSAVSYHVYDAWCHRMTIEP